MAEPRWLRPPLWGCGGILADAPEGGKPIHGPHRIDQFLLGDSGKVAQVATGEEHQCLERLTHREGRSVERRAAVSSWARERPEATRPIESPPKNDSFTPSWPSASLALIAVSVPG